MWVENTKSKEYIHGAGATLNSQKSEFGRTKLISISWGYIIHHTEIQADHDKALAIIKMTAPTAVFILWRFMGLIKQLGEFMANLVELTQPLQKLLRKYTAQV